MGRRKITNEEEALAAVRKDGWALQYVPPNLMTAELCLEAVKQDCFALQVVPSELKTAEVCLEAVLKFGSVFTIISTTGKRITKKSALKHRR